MDDKDEIRGVKYVSSLDFCNQLIEIESLIDNKKL